MVHLAIRNSLDSEAGLVNEQTPFGVFGAPHFSRPDGVSQDPIALDDDFQNAMVMDLALQNELVFEFDALSTDSSLLFLVTTRTGGLLGIRRISSTFSTTLPFTSTAPLTSPSLWVSANHWMAVAIQNARTPKAQIVGTRLELSDKP